LKARASLSDKVRHADRIVQAAASLGSSIDLRHALQNARHTGGFGLRAALHGGAIVKKANQIMRSEACSGE
jgi:hypothetical protein